MPDPSTKPAPPTPGLFVAVGQYGQRAISDDGVTWRDHQIGREGEVYRAVKFGNGRYVAAGTYGGKNSFAASPDGLTWQRTEKDGQYKLFVHGLGFGKGTFVAVGGQPEIVGVCVPFVLPSVDGVTWADYIDIKGATILRRVAFGKGPDGQPLFVAVGDRGRRSASPDGRAWSDAKGTKAIDTLIDVAYGTPGGKGLFVGVGLHGLRMTSTDGLAWSPRVVGEEGEHLNAIVWTGDRFVAVGMGATYTSPDGWTWSRKENKDAPLVMAYGKSVFVGANWRGRILLSEDAVTWRQVFKSEHNFEAVCFGAE